MVFARLHRLPRPAGRVGLPTLEPDSRTENRTDADAVSANCFLKKSLPRRFTSLHTNAAATRRPAFSLRSTHGCGEDLTTSSLKSSLGNNFDTRWPWRLRGDLLLKSYRRRHCFYSRVLANWAASGDVTRSVSEGERSKQPRIQSVLKRQPSLTLRVTCGFAALLLWGRQSPSPSRVRRGIELDPSCTTTIGPSDS